MKRFLLLLIPVLVIGCADTDAPPDSEPREDLTESPIGDAGSNDLTGTWVLVDQRGYGPDHPGDVEQVLTFGDNGRMTNVQSTGGQSSAMVLTYRVEGNQIKASVESVEMNGEPLDIGDGMLEQTFHWRIESGRLIIEGSPGTQDVYRRAD